MATMTDRNEPAEGSGVPTHCSFCGSKESECGGLAQGGGEDGGGGPLVSICFDCAMASAEALRGERQLAEARLSHRPSSLRADQQDLGKLCGDSTFSFEGEDWLWNAERVINMDSDSQIVLTVRRATTGQTVSVNVDTRGEPVEAYAKRTAAWLCSNNASNGVASKSLLRDWTEVAAEGETFQWRVERVQRVGAKRTVLVHVKNQKTGERTTVQFDGKTEPTLDNAVMAATLCKAGVPSEAVAETDDSLD